jgi:predicted nucleotidyltransferase
MWASRRLDVARAGAATPYSNTSWLGPPFHRAGTRARLAAMGSTASLQVAGHLVDRARLAEICARYGVAELYVFGSAARGEAGDASDVDVLYVLAPGSRLGFAVNQLEDELVELFGRPVDLIAKKALHPRLRATVLAEAQLLHAA